MTEEPEKDTSIPNDRHAETTGQPPERAEDQPTPMDDMDNLRDANERLTPATLQAQEDAEASATVSDTLRRLVAKLEASEAALREKNAELELFHDIVVGRELKMMQLEKENAQLRQEVNRLKSGTHLGRHDRGRDG